MSEHTVPAFTEANRRRVDPNACACRVDDGEIIYCALHAAAPALLAALKAILDVLKPDSLGYLQGDVNLLTCEHMIQAREAIKEAEGA